MGRRQFGLVIAIGFVFALIGCSGPVEVLPDGFERIVVSVAPIPGSEAADLVVVSPSAESRLDAGSSTVEFVVQSDRPAVVAVMDVARDFGWTAVWPAWFEAAPASLDTALTAPAAGVGVGPLSTAVQMVYSLPMFANRDIGAQREIVATLRSLPEIGALAEALVDHATSHDVFEVPAYKTAFDAALEASFVALGDVDSAHFAEQRNDRGAPLAPLVLDVEQFTLDQAQTVFELSNGRLHAAWYGGGSLTGDARGLTWLGRVYEIDAAEFDSLEDLVATWATSNHAWRTDISIRSASGNSGLYLGAETVYGYLDIIDEVVELAFDILDDSLGFAPGGIELADDRVYAAHLYTCANGADGMGGENAVKDRELMTHWAAGAGWSSFEMACVVNWVEIALASISAFWDLGDQVDDDVIMESVEQLMAEALAGMAEDYVAADVWSTESIAALSYRVVLSLTENLIAAVSEDVAKQGAIASLKFFAKSLAGALDVPARVASLSELGARIGAMIAITPWEGAVIVTGQPFAAAPDPTPDPDPGDNPPAAFSLDTADAFCTPEGSPGVALRWNASAGATLYSVYRNGQPYADLQSLVPQFDNTLGVVAGQSYTYQIRASNAFGFADSNSRSTAVPLDVCATQGGSGTSPTISASVHHSVAVRADGSVWSWGSNGYGQLGVTEPPVSHVPVQVPGLEDAIGVAAGERHSLALLSDGSVWSWGGNHQGQLGRAPSEEANPQPLQVAGLPVIVGLAAGWHHSLALDANGRVWSWGTNEYGQLGIGLGIGTGAQSSTPTVIASISNIVMIDAGPYHSIAVRSDGTAWAWGNNGHAQLGDGTRTPRYESRNHRNVPVRVTGLTKVVTVGAGWGHSVAVLEDGSIRIWGCNERISTGSGGWTCNVDLEPVAFPAVVGARRVSAGGTHTLALLDDGSLVSWTWSWNATAHALGHGSLDFEPNVPQPVQSMEGAVAVEAGHDHSFAIRDDHTVWAWGKNSNGQLGDGSYTDRSAPTDVIWPPE